jgi:hypothetical protein
MNLLLLINHHISHCQQMSTMQQKTAHQAVYRHTPHHAAQQLREVPNAPRKPRHNMPLDLAPLVCSAAAFASEIEDAQDPVTPIQAYVNVQYREAPRLERNNRH